MTDDIHNEETDSPLSTQTADLTYHIDETEQASTAVVRAVASLTNTPVLDLAPLYEVIDSDHLNRFVEKTEGDTNSMEPSVTFRFNGCQVTVTKREVHVQASRQ